MDMTEDYDIRTHFYPLPRSGSHPSTLTLTPTHHQEAIVGSSFQSRYFLMSKKA